MGKQLREKDTKYQAHEAFWEQASRNADLLCIENVTEYDLGAYIRRYLPEWDCYVAKVDPRLWGFSTSRPRVYGIAWNTQRLRRDPAFPFQDVIESLRARPAMSARDYAFMSLGSSTLPAGQDALMNNTDK